MSSVFFSDRWTYLNRISMEDDSSVTENGLPGAFVSIDDSFIRLSLLVLVVNGLPLNTGLKRSIIDISNSHKHGAKIKL